MGLTAAFLGAAGAFLPKSATAAWGCASRGTREGGRERRRVSRVDARARKKHFSRFFQLLVLIFLSGGSRPERMVVSRRSRSAGRAAGCRASRVDEATRARALRVSGGALSAARRKNRRRRGRRGSASLAFGVRALVMQDGEHAARGWRAICRRARRETHLGGRGDGGLRREHLGGRRHGGAEGQGRGHRVCVRTDATVRRARTSRRFRRANARRAARLAASLEFIGRRDPPRRWRTKPRNVFGVGTF